LTRHMLFCFFFFSSRRRHTRSKRDWSSDVCSSDLEDLQSSLAADGYEMQIEQSGEKARVSISAADGICGDCLVPKPLMLGMLERSEERRVGKECRCGWGAYQ